MKKVMTVNDLPWNIRSKIADYCWEHYGDDDYTFAVRELLDKYNVIHNIGVNEFGAVIETKIIQFTSEAEYTMFLLRFA